MKFFCLLVISLIISCSSGMSFKKTPVDQFIRDLDKEKTFTIILHDIDIEGSFFKTYKHQYKIITAPNGEPKEEISEWFEVPKKLFMRHENDLGMELASKDSTGKISKQVTPAGFSNYVGNPQYGQWVQGSGGSFWEFYGKYAFISAMFDMFDRPRYGYYNDYRNNYRNKRPYYGPRSGGSSYYGTYGKHTKKARPNFFKRKAAKIQNNSKSFKERVRNRVNRSTSRSTTRRSRSSSRYRSSSFRSRGGGFGK